MKRLKYPSKLFLYYFNIKILLLFYKIEALKIG